MVMKLWRCLAPEGQSDRRDFTKSLVLWFVFSNMAASLISILTDLWETAKVTVLAYWRWVFIQNTHFSCPLVTAWIFLPLSSAGLSLGKAFDCFVFCFNKPTTSFFMDLTSEPRLCESKLARKDHTKIVIRSGIIKWYQNTEYLIKY